MGELEKLRQELTRIDQALLRLFFDRMNIVDRVADIKMRTKEPVFVPEQEARVLANVETQTPPELAPYATALARTLMRLSRERQYEHRVHDDLSWDLGKVIVGAKKVLPHGDFTVVPADAVESACSQMASGVIDTALLPFTPESLHIIKKHTLFIQACLEVPEGRQIVVGSQLIVEEEARYLSLLIKDETTNALSLVINVLSDLGLAVNAFQSLGDEGFHLEFAASPADQRPLRALYQIEREVSEMRLLGWYTITGNQV